MINGGDDMGRRRNPPAFEVKTAVPLAPIILTSCPFLSRQTMGATECFSNSIALRKGSAVAGCAATATVNGGAPAELTNSWALTVVRCRNPRMINMRLIIPVGRRQPNWMPHSISGKAYAFFGLALNG